MGILSTGPIENRPVGGVRPTQQVTVKFVNRDSANSSTVLIRGFHLNGTRTLYVLETVTLTRNEVATRNYFANFDTFQFVFTTSGPAAESTEISVWGKNASGQLVTAHRLVSDELLGSEATGATGPQGPTGLPGEQGTQVPLGPVEPESAFRAEKLSGAQDYTANNLKVTYPDQVFDLNDEYDPATSTFVPKQSGVYSICASLFFLRNDSDIDAFLELTIRVNGMDRVEGRQFVAAGIGGFSPVIDICSIIELQANQMVDVSFFANQSGSIQPAPFSTHFEAARFPSQ
ncbi:MAG: hypothetical protein ACQEWV_12655 [Bacillota bacterium]